VRGDAQHLRALPGVVQIRVDVTDPASVAAAAAEVTRRQGGRGLHAVINNAGIIVQGPIELVPADELRRQFAINVFGPAEIIRAFAPLLRTGGGRLVNISAPTAKLAMPFASPISASKAALDALSDAARVELKAQGVAVVTVVPGAVETSIFAKAESAAASALAAADPARLALYQRQLTAVGEAMAKMRTSKPEKVSDTIVKVLDARRPKARYLASCDVRRALLLARLPVRLRDRVVAGLLGLNSAKAA
jgi:NAD(P)-dependent dehydrogenase (short-subunit alcohol dehydrogenase family)